jgi:hypothetical protein
MWRWGALAPIDLQEEPVQGGIPSVMPHSLDLKHDSAVISAEPHLIAT